VVIPVGLGRPEVLAQIRSFERGGEVLPPGDRGRVAVGARVAETQPVEGDRLSFLCRLDGPVDDDPEVEGLLQVHLLADRALALGSLAGLGRDDVRTRSLDDPDVAVDVLGRRAALAQRGLIEPPQDRDEPPGRPQITAPIGR